MAYRPIVCLLAAKARTTTTVLLLLESEQIVSNFLRMIKYQHQIYFFAFPVRFLSGSCPMSCFVIHRPLTSSGVFHCGSTQIISPNSPLLFWTSKSRQETCDSSTAFPLAAIDRRFESLRRCVCRPGRMHFRASSMSMILSYYLLSL